MYERRIRKREILRPACGGTQNDLEGAGRMDATATGYLTPFCPPLHTMERGNRGRGFCYKSSPEDRNLPWETNAPLQSLHWVCLRFSPMFLSSLVGAGVEPFRASLQDKPQPQQKQPPHCSGNL